MDVADRSDRPEVLGGLNPSTRRSTGDVLIAGGGGRVARLLLFRPSGW
jgi:hypothetical protein